MNFPTAQPDLYVDCLTGGRVMFTKQLSNAIRSRKSDRLPRFKIVLPEPALLHHCEPLASPFADPIFGSIGVSRA